MTLKYLELKKYLRNVIVTFIFPLRTLRSDIQPTYLFSIFFEKKNSLHAVFSDHCFLLPQFLPGVSDLPIHPIIKAFSYPLKNKHANKKKKTHTKTQIHE